MDNEILTSLLLLELQTQARKLQFTERDPPKSIDEATLREAISVLNELSIQNTEHSKKKLIAISALLWQYRDRSWNGLKDYLLLFLSRAGFGPSTVMLDNASGSQKNEVFLRSSFINEIAITVAQTENEVILGNQTLLLTDFQKELWDNLKLNPIVGISAPTSSGKSYLILLQAMRLLLEGPGTIIYIVPTLSLVNQVVNDFRKMLERFGLQEYVVESGFHQEEVSKKSIYVLTQEKAITILSEDKIPFERLRLLVIDEIQNVERAESAEDIRAKILYDLMIDLQASICIDQIVLSGPRILQIDKLGKTIFGQDTVKQETNASPVLNLTFSIGERKRKYFLKLRTDLIPKVLEIEIELDYAVAGYGKKDYNESYLGYLTDLVSNFDNECALIFSPTSGACSKISEYFNSHLPGHASSLMLDLSKFISNTVHPKYSLSDATRSGIVYHHGKVPTHVRNAVEHVIKSGEARIVIATTTLLQGVNLPVQNIFIRNPNLFLRKNKDNTILSNYELANLRGRAGRLLKDFVGRTFILDESGFEEDGKQMDLFKDTEKKLEVGYGRKYEEYKVKIAADIKDQTGSNKHNKQYHYLTTYIRQAALKYGVNTQGYLARVGIILSNKEINDVLAAVREINVDKTICARNRYWDPIDLAKLQNAEELPLLPSVPYGFHNGRLIEALLDYLRGEFPIYYERYMKRDQDESQGRIKSLSILASNWVKEWPLIKILDTDYNSNTQRIDDAIKALESNISFGMALLFKPIYSIHRPDSLFPQYLETGAWHPLTRKLIGINIPRETAILLRTKLDLKETADRNQLIAGVRAIKPTLPYWHRIQIEDI